MDRSTGREAQNNADEIVSILFRKELKIWDAVVAKRQPLGDGVLPILKSWRARRGLDGTLRNAGSSPVRGLKKEGYMLIRHDGSNLNG